MLKLALLTTTALVFASPAFAGGEYNPPPKPTPPTQTQGQAQGQIQGQQQHQTAKGGAGGNGGSVTNNITTGPGGAATPAAAAAAPSVNVQNNNGGATSGTGNSGWNGSQFPASSATAPSFALADKCQWAASGGAQAFFAGASGGGAGLYEFCKDMMKAKYFREQGMPDMAKALECKNADFRDAFKQTGNPCREDLTKEQLAAERTASAAPAPRAGYIGPNGFVPYPAGYKPSN